MRSPCADRALHVVVQAGVVMVPWILMSTTFNHTPPSIVTDITWRWSQDMHHEHPHSSHVDRDRYNMMEHKVIARLSAFDRSAT